MNLQDYFDFIDNTSIRIKGHRVYIDEVLKHHLQGKEPEEILQYFPNLPLEKIYAALLYYEANKSEVEGYLQRVQQHEEKSRQEWLQIQDTMERFVEKRENLRKTRKRQIAEGKFNPLWDEPA